MNESGFVCYFCNKLIENDSRVSHSSVCANVLIPCPNKCGAYITRANLKSHQNECLNRRSATLDRPQTSKLSTLQSTIQTLHQRLLQCETAQSHQIDPNRIDFLIHEQQLAKNWQKTADFKLETLKDAVMAYERGRNDHDLQLLTLQAKIPILERLEREMNIHIETFVNEHNYNADKFDDLYRKLTEACNNQLANFNDFKNDGVEQKEQNLKFEATLLQLRNLLDEQKTKLASTIFEVKTINHIASTCEEQFEIQEREFKDVKRQLEQLQLDFEILENLSSGECGFGAPVTSPGHLIWRISDFNAKFSHAREHNLVLKSQVFYSHDFGYKLRVLVYLNGLKKWKDRYALISLHVLKGEFDPLLEWPCRIEGVASLRDLSSQQNPKNFTKCITAKRNEGGDEGEEPQESSSSYIFIPHSTLTKSIFLQNDCLFLEVLIEHLQKPTETTL